MKFLVSFMLSIFFGFSAVAGIRDIGSGGAGVIKDGQLYLLDLFEVGIMTPLIDTSINADADLLAKAQAMPHFTSDERMLFAQKLTELRRYAPHYANILALAIEKYHWYLMDTPLALIREETPLDLSQVQMVQIANRLEKRIRIYRPYWEQLSSLNKVALVIHELVYSVQRPQFIKEWVFKVESIRVRSTVAWMFSEELATTSPFQIEELTGVENKLSKIRDGRLVALDRDYVVIDGFQEMNLEDSLEKESACAYVQSQLVKHSQVHLTRELHISSAVLFFSSYQNEQGTHQQSLKVSMSPFSNEDLAIAPWSSEVIPLPGLVFNAENAGNCEKILDDAHKKSKVYFQGP